MKRSIRVSLLLIPFTMFSFAAYAVEFKLKSFDTNGTNNITHGTYSSLSECQEAKREKEEENNTGRTYWCLRMP